MSLRVVKGAVIGIVAGTLGLALLLSQDRHHCNGRYLLWEYLAVGDWRDGIRYLTVDAGFRVSFEGRERSHLLRWFPDLRSEESRQDGSSAHGELERLPRGEWLGDTNWLVVYENGRVRSIVLVKG
jgi:hypothetical protein